MLFSCSDSEFCAVVVIALSPVTSHQTDRRIVLSAVPSRVQRQKKPPVLFRTEAIIAD
jgi:hypothetical protein